MKRIKRSIRQAQARLLGKHEGATAIEYGLIAALIAVASYIAS
jgi:Flp pilus assembly pilin Flp